MPTNNPGNRASTETPEFAPQRTQEATPHAAASRQATRLLRPACWTAFGAYAIWLAANLIPNLALRLQFEDQLIVLRHARNLAEGNGLIYNLGERVMGFTTPLFTVLSALFVAIGGTQHAAAWQNGFGILCMLGTAALAARLLVRTGAGPAAPLVVALVTFNPAGAHNFLYMGMETHLFAFLFLLAVDLHLSQRSTAACVVAALLFLTRPEGVLLAAMLALADWLRERKLPIRQSVACLLTVLPWLLFATLYYGSPIPATLPAKAGSFLVHLPGYLNHVGEVYAEAAGSVVATISPSLAGQPWAWLPLAVLACLGCVTVVRRCAPVWPLVAFPVATVLGYGLLGSWPDFTWHYYTLNVLFAVALAHGVCTGAYAVLRMLQGALPRHGHPRFGNGTTLQSAAVVLLLALASPVFVSNHVQANYRAEIGERRERLAGMGRTLEERFDSNTSVLLDEIGHLGWNCSLRIVDMAGLVTPGLRFDVPRDLAVERHRPDLLLLHDSTQEWVPQTSAFPENLGYAEVQDLSLAPGYRLWQFTGTSATNGDAAEPYRVVRGPGGNVEALVEAVASPLASPRRFAVMPPGNGPTGFFENVTVQSPLKARNGDSYIAVDGWAADTSHPDAVPELVIVSGDRAVASAMPGVARPDVATQLGLPSDSVGFRFTVAADFEQVRRAGFVGYVLSPGGIASPLGYFHQPLRREGGRETLPVTDGRRLIVRDIGDGFEGMVDRVSTVDEQTVLEGRAFDTKGGLRPRKLAVYRNRQFVISFDAGVQRDDVAERPGDPRLGATGFRAVVPGAPRPDRFGKTHRVFALFDREAAAVELPLGDNR